MNSWTRRIVGLWAVALVVSLAPEAMSADIYVSIQRGKNKKGEGTTASPFKNIEWAIKKAQPGDVIHVAEGHYPGMARRGHWEVTTNNLTFLAGYKDDFSARDPFTHVTLLAWDDSPQNKTKRFPGPEFQAVKDAGARRASCLGGIVIDGFTLDGGPRNAYRADKGNPSLKRDKTPNDTLVQIAVETGSVGVVRNCTFLNPGETGCVIAQARPGGRVEIYNNVFVNSLYHQLDVGTKQDRKGGRADFDIHHNTFLFAWKVSGNGSGVYVRPYSNVKVHSNILAWGDLYALSNAFYEKKLNERGIPVKQGLANENVEFDNNLLHMWQRGIYGWVMEGQSGILATTNVDELEDTSLASAEGNQIADPHFEYNKQWMTHYVNRQDSVQGEVTMDAMNRARQILGLPLQAAPGTNRKGYAMRYPLADVMKFRQPKAPEANGRGATMQLVVLEPGKPGRP